MFRALPHRTDSVRQIPWQSKPRTYWAVAATGSEEVPGSI